MIKKRIIQGTKKVHDMIWDGPDPQNDVTTSYLSYATLDNLRIIFCVYCTLLIIYENSYSYHAIISNLQYLTIWGLYISLSYFWLAVLGKNWKLAHIIFEIAFSVQLAITIMYWIAVYPTQEDKQDTFAWWTETISLHGGVLLFLWIDNIFNDIRFYKRHTVFLAGFLNICVTFTYGPVYKAIDWNSAMSYIYSAAAIMVGMMHFFIGVLFFQVFKKHKVTKEKNTDNGYYLGNNELY